MSPKGFITTKKNKLLNKSFFDKNGKMVNKKRTNSQIVKAQKITERKRIQNTVLGKALRTNQLLLRKLSEKRKLTFKEENTLLERIKTLTQKIKNQAKENRISAIESTNEMMNLREIIKDLKNARLISDEFYKKYSSMRQKKQ